MTKSEVVYIFSLDDTKSGEDKPLVLGANGREIVPCGTNRRIAASAETKLRCLDSIGKAKHLTANERGLLLILYRLSVGDEEEPQEWAWPTINLLAEEMDKSRDTAKRTVRALENKGFLTVRETRTHHGFLDANQYRVEYRALIADEKKR